MKIYFAGTSGTKTRAKIWLTLIRSRLLSYYDIVTPEMKCHFVKGEFELLKVKK